MHKDVVIIGSGIAGLTCAIYLKRANIDFVVIEKNDVGGLLNKLKRVDNYPGFSSCSGKDILLSLRKQIDELGIEVIKNIDIFNCLFTIPIVVENRDEVIEKFYNNLIRCAVFWEYNEYNKDRQNNFIDNGICLSISENTSKQLKKILK